MEDDKARTKDRQRVPKGLRKTVKAALPAGENAGAAALDQALPIANNAHLDHRPQVSSNHPPVHAHKALHSDDFEFDDSPVDFDALDSAVSASNSIPKAARAFPPATTTLTNNSNGFQPPKQNRLFGGNLLSGSIASNASSSASVTMPSNIQSKNQHQPHAANYIASQSQSQSHTHQLSQWKSIPPDQKRLGQNQFFDETSALRVQPQNRSSSSISNDDVYKANSLHGHHGSMTQSGHQNLQNHSSPKIPTTRNATPATQLQSNHFQNQQPQNRIPNTGTAHYSTASSQKAGVAGSNFQKPPHNNHPVQERTMDTSSAHNDKYKRPPLQPPRPSLLRFQAPKFVEQVKPEPHLLQVPTPQPSAQPNTHQMRHYHQSPEKTPAESPSKVTLSQPLFSDSDEDEELFAAAAAEAEMMIASQAVPIESAALSKLNAHRSSLNHQLQLSESPRAKPSITIAGLNSPRSHQKRMSKRLPGPAGELPDQLSPSSLRNDSRRDSPFHSNVASGGQNLSGAGGESPAVKKRRLVGGAHLGSLRTKNNSEFTKAAWTTMLEFVANYDSYPTTGSLTPEFLHQHKNKIAELVVLIHDLKPTDNDASALFIDPCGSVRGTIHANAFDMFDADALGVDGCLNVGSVVHLKNVSVFCLGGDNSDGGVYLNVTGRNVYAVFTNNGTMLGPVGGAAI
ncbi:hypothetical protein CcCBS67573_g03277 [Chytriomyces confervae]|uniref:Homologous recombination OB-fold protein OB-fold domain-containing protein n=1 Tax=Chytriomyces confervae TaxID=246404 RepID=A0A507FK71_9FUNG|nr:hypothetical protein HDU80_007084 [Chytriomyces hyalinus]TPX75457.1 hypothetical protein CcCBS67573_g03277 [Chytriomyces confervae]